jgi:hypothetical protein
VSVHEGVEYQLDVLIYATGFQWMGTSTFNMVTGRGGRTPGSVGGCRYRKSRSADLHLARAPERTIAAPVSSDLTFRRARVSFGGACDVAQNPKRDRALASPVPHLASRSDYFLIFAFLARAADP